MNTKHALSYRIAFFDTKPYDREYFDRASAGRKVEIRYYPVRLSSDTAALAKGYDAVCAFVNDDLDKATADILVEEGVRVVALRCAGYNNVDLKAVWGRLHVLRVPSYSPHAVAEHALALLMALNRKTHKAYNRTRDGNFALSGLVGFDLYGKTAGIVGTGQIGRITSGILKGLGMELLVSDPYPNTEWAESIGARYVPLDELFRSSDVVSLHCPLNAESWHLINEDVLKTMKSRSIILNTGRGALIDTKALIMALKENRIGGAGLDVYEEEDEYFFEDHSSDIIKDDVLARLLTLPNVLVTSHQAFLTVEALQAIAETSLANLDVFFAGGDLQNEICYRCTQKTCTRKTSGKCF
ncbi:2-hydroxyacid dehydrogenase [Treponema sp.]